MEKLLKFILDNLVDDKSSISIEKREDDKSVVFEVSVSEQDKGKVIGKNGKVAQAIRTVLHSASYKDDKKYILKIK